MANEGSGSQIQEATPSTTIPADKAITYRLQGVPPRFSKSGLEDALKSALNLEAGVTFKVKSLADDPSPGVSTKRIATLDFSRNPKRFSENPIRGGWPIQIGVDDVIHFDTCFQGWTPLHSTPDDQCTTDLIAVSGLASHAFGSLKARNGSYMWLRDALPVQFPKMRIFIYGFDSQLKESESTQNYDDVANRFQTSIRNIRTFSRDNDGRPGPSHPRPIILLGHSLGGIIIKLTLYRMAEGDEYSDRVNLMSTCGMLLFGVPNYGMEISHLAAIVEDSANRTFVQQLDKTSDILKIIRDKFPSVLPFKDARIYSFYETMHSPTAKIEDDGKLKLTGKPVQLVDTASATYGRPGEDGGNHIHPINRIHSDLVKFTSEYDEDYKLVLGCLRDIEKNACRIIKNRFISPRDMIRSLVDSVRIGKFMEVLSTVDQNKHKPTLRASADKPNASWVLGNVDYQLWENSNNFSDSRPRVLLITGPPKCNIHQVLTYISSITAQKPKHYVLYFTHSAINKGKPTSTQFIHTLLYQIISLLPADKQIPVIKSFLSHTIEGIIKETNDENQLLPLLKQKTSSGKINMILNEAVDQCRAALCDVLTDMNECEILLVVDGLVGADTKEHDFLNSLSIFVNNLHRLNPKAKTLLTSQVKDEIKGFGTLLHIEYDQERQECLRSLRFDNTRFKNISKQQYGTLEWFWSSPEYKGWSTAETSSILLIQGKPGSGKSTLAKHFNDNLRERELATEPAVVAKYFYSAREGELHTSHYSMLRSILFDIIAQDESFFYPAFQSEYRKELKGRTPGTPLNWQYSRLKETLLLLRDHSPGKQLYLIIDAVDEADDEDRRDIFGILFRICSEATGCILKLFIASRPVGVLDRLVMKYKNIAKVLTLQHYTRSDIRNFTCSFVRELEFDEYYEEAVEYIVKNAQGVFVWVELVRRQLLKFNEQARPIQDVLKYLKGLPLELKAMYKRMLQELLREDEDILRRSRTIFIFVLFARRPLALDELIHATCTWDEHPEFTSSHTLLNNMARAKQFYITVCGGNFIEYIEETKTVQVIHHTVREFFFTDDGISKSVLWSNIEDAHIHISRTCLRYIQLWSSSLPYIDERTPQIRSPPFTSWTSTNFEDCAQYFDGAILTLFALDYLGFHINRCSGKSAVRDAVSEFLDKFTNTPAAYLLNGWPSSFLKQSFPSIINEIQADRFMVEMLQAASTKRFYTTLRMLLVVGSGIVLSNRNEQTALKLAIQRGCKVLNNLWGQRTIVPNPPTR
ncbi:uncharacterized protein F4807DRAFT_353339 [Annulohypoxylon truncatum]|uniref:uncharacterized protein n=1 Tax=Annulohypoxylon truncatum TaxID=327061 RepID=UPI0020074446|nr:uncharacterized protein F4807DRAFT_353339 [Annulohypoxylon truncatum]KAI1204287.1 hypothetical protein F4807DRAFT_353339 [Annulohypoxylon truncatum]